MTTISGISSEEVKARLKQINEDTPVIWTTSLVKEPQELSVRTVVRNNIMLEKVLDNQAQIMKNQAVMMEKMGVGEKLDLKA